MGEDSCSRNMSSSVETKSGNFATNGDFCCPRQQQHTTSISSCSEADSESTNTCCGDTTIEDDDENDFQYGPGIVSKLRTKFLSITMKQGRGGGFHGTMRRSCSLENILETKSFPEPTSHQKRFVQNKKECGPAPPWSNLKRAKSMDTLLFNMESQSNDVSETDSEKDAVPNCQSKIPWREPKLIRRKDGPLNRPTITICDEELPKPDTVKTYKRMFEPADSKKTGSMNSNVRRRPPVLRASAKSVSSTNLKSQQLTNGKVNGVSSPSSKILPPKPKVCAKEFSKNNSSNNIPALINNGVPKQCKSVQRNDEADVEAQVRNMNMKNISESQRISKDDVDLAKTVSDESTQKPRESNFRRNLRPVKYIEGTNTKPPVPLYKPPLLKKTVPNKPPALSPPVPPPSKIAEKPVIPTKKEEIREQQPQDNNIESPAKRNGSPNVIEKFNSDLAARNGHIVKNHLEDETKTSKLVQRETAIDNEKSDNVVVKSGLSNGTHDAVPPSRATPEAVEKTNCLVVTNGEELTTPPKKLVNGSSNSMVFDFRGKEVTSHVALQPAPFGCKAAIISSKKRALVMIDGKESVPYVNGSGCSNGSASVDDEDDYFVDYSVPAPCGLVFEGENVRVGKGALLSTRNKDLKIHFDEDVEKNTFVYPSESSLLVTDDSSLSDLSSLETTDNVAAAPPDGASQQQATVVNGTASLLTATNKLLLKSVPSINTNGTSSSSISSSSSSLMSYTPSVLRTVDNIQPGLFRADKDKALKKSEVVDSTSEQENRNGCPDKDGDSDEGDMLKPADPEFISSWSLSANTSDLLF